MPLLTRQNIDPNHFRYYLDWREQDKGKTLYQQAQAKVTEFTGESAVCEVSEKKQTFTVKIQVSRNQIIFGCTCQANNPNPRLCRHELAATYALRDYLQSVAEKDWRYRLELILSSAPTPPAPKKSQPPQTFPPGLDIDRPGNQQTEQQTLFLRALAPLFPYRANMGTIA
jgi:hypothetical protein